jgi:glucose-1-phosphate thymidylyltransferase
MKAIIPLAGKGTRLRPLTHHTPKPLLKVGGRPVLSYLLDDVKALGVEEMVFIVGYRQEVIRDFIASEYPELTPHFVVQETMDGTAGAVKLAEPWADEELMILFADTLFDADLGLATRLDEEWAGVLWAMEVEDYQRFGVIVPDESGAMTRIVEKPSEPISKLANIGIYYIRDHELLFEGIDATLAGTPGKGGEFYLTDAFQYMADHGARLKTAPVTGWYDCGKVETLLETNGHLLSTTRGGIDDGATVEDADIVEPVRIEAGAVLKGGRIGPNVTVERGAHLEDCIVRDTIVGAEAHLDDVELTDSLVGARATVRGFSGTLNVADDSAVVED